MVRTGLSHVRLPIVQFPKVVNAIAEKPDVVLGVLPCGKGNDFAEALKIPTKPVDAIGVLWEGTTRQVDLGKIGDHYFDTIVTCGYDAEVRSARYRGRLAFFWDSVLCLYGNHDAF